MPWENEERQSTTPGIPDDCMNEAFSDSHTTELSFHSVSNVVDSTSILPGDVSDSENYIRTRSYSANNSPEKERKHYARRPLTPQVTKTPREKRSYANGPGKFSQRCINHYNRTDFKRGGENTEGGTHAANLEDEDASDIKPEPQQLPHFSFRNFERKKKILAASLALTNFAAMFCLSVMAPFFPQLARTVGVSGTISGWIFGVFALVQFLTSPLFGKLVPRVGAWLLYQAGLFLAAGCTVLFGFVSYIPRDDGGTVFVVFCFMLRIFMALGCTALATASFAITGHEFADYASIMFGILETFAGVGLMVGPAIGGFLYAAWGFPLPFIVIGVVMFLILILNWILLPGGIEDAGLDVKSTPVIKLLRIPSILLVCLSLVVSASIWAILDPILEPHLQEFQLGSELLGLLFLLMSASYAISSPLWGWLSEKTPDSKIVVVIGFIGSGFSLFLLAPSPLLGFAEGENILWLNIVALLFLGVTISMAVIPTFESVLDSAELAGLEDNMGTYATVAGLWGSMYALGDFVGPVLGGLLEDAIGFQWSITYMGIGSLATGIIILVLYLYELKFGRIGALKVGDNASGSDSLENRLSDDSDGMKAPLLVDERANGNVVEV
ncbi:MFS-type transporter SLC18B1-like [Lineus longissimus]|uniref:MFS-type transporter SLC18B1-like n=1 Tax=Lineus longissimus TaxID=88925 RepID=UPI002B4DD109